MRWQIFPVNVNFAGGPTGEPAPRQSFRHQPVAGTVIAQRSDHGACAIDEKVDGSIARILLQGMANLCDKAVDATSEIGQGYPEQDRALMGVQNHRPISLVPPTRAAAWMSSSSVKAPRTRTTISLGSSINSVVGICGAGSTLASSSSGKRTKPAERSASTAECAELIRGAGCDCDHCFRARALMRRARQT